MKHWVALLTLGMVVCSCSSVLAATDSDTAAQLQALQEKVAALEAQLNQQSSYQDRQAELMKELMAKDPGTEKYRLGADTGLTAGYDKRFYIKSADDQFKLEFDTRLQFRYYYAQTDDGGNNVMADGTRPTPPSDNGVDSSAHGFELERARIYLRGHVLNDWNFKIALAGGDDSGDAYLYTYELSHNFMDELGIHLGRFKGPFGKQETTSSGALMMIDRSLANEVFNIDRVTGVELYGTIDMGDAKPGYRIMAFNGLQNNNENPFVDNDNSVGVAARLAVPLMGATQKDFANESDLAFHDNPVMQIGTSFAYGNDRDEDNFAGGESDTYEFLGKGIDGRTDIYELGGEMTMFGADVAFKYQGLSLIAEGFIQCIDGDLGEIAGESDFASPNRSSGMIDGAELDNYGWYTQAGYFVVPETFELVSRVSGVCVDSANDCYEYAGGWNYYISGQDLKLSMDVTYIDDLPLSSSSPNFHGIQNNSLFLFRTQLQFQF